MASTDIPAPTPRSRAHPSRSFGAVRVAGWVGGVTGWIGRIARAVGSIRYISRPRELPPPAGAGVPQAGTYAVAQSMSAYAAFPWVRACVDAIAEDLAGLPLVAYRGRGRDAVVLPTHPALDLLAHPTSTMGEMVWRQQLVTFLLLPGNAYAVMLGGRHPASLPLLHPLLVHPIPGPIGPVGYEYHPTGAAPVYYAAEDVLHIRLPGWEEQTWAQLGEGLIRALHHDLDADHKAARLAAHTAALGRPAALVTPKDGRLSPQARDTIGRAYAQMLRDGSSVIVVDDAVEVHFPALTLRDMEFVEQRALTRRTVLAAFGVPPIRLAQTEDANFATAQQSLRAYWTRLQAHAARIDDQLTRLARRWDPDVSIRHDFAGVDALQESRSERLSRVRMWVDLGATPAAAAAYEGFDDAPVGDATQATYAAAAAAAGGVVDLRAYLAAATPRPDGASGPLAGTESHEEARGVGSYASRAVVAPEGEQARASRWRAWLDGVYTPALRQTAPAVAEALAAQAGRLAERMSDLPIGRSGHVAAVAMDATLRRDIVAGIVDWLFAGELAAVADALRAAVDTVLRATYRLVLAELGATGAEDAAVARRQSFADEVAARIEPESREVVRVIISDGLAGGESIAQMQARLQAAAGFGRVRAQAIARTETTRAVGTITRDAYADALVYDGLRVQKQWLSARDGEVRDDHAALDGQTQALDAPFVSPGPDYPGASAQAPGGFAEAAMVVHCRCCIIPVVTDAGAGDAG